MFTDFLGTFIDVIFIGCSFLISLSFFTRRWRFHVFLVENHIALHNSLLSKIADNAKNRVNLVLPPSFNCDIISKKITRKQGAYYGILPRTDRPEF